MALIIQLEFWEFLLMHLLFPVQFQQKLGRQEVGNWQNYWDPYKSELVAEKGDSEQAGSRNTVNLSQ